MARQLTHFALLPCAVLLLLLSGCGGDDGLSRVSGCVTLDDKPFAGALVEFQPVAEGQTPSTDLTNAEGRYDLMYTFDARGAVAGEHVVKIRTAAAYYEDEDSEEIVVERIPAVYHSESRLRRTVEPGRNAFDFDLRSTP